MQHPSVEEFTDALLRRPLAEIVRAYIFQGVPYVFRDHPEAMTLLARHLQAALPITEQNITVVGSAKIGFSLSPHNFPRSFSDESDIDVLIVDERLFDQVWATILKWHYPRRVSLLGNTDGRWARERRKDLYWGWFVPDKIRFDGLSFPHVLKPVRDVSTQWFNAFRSLSRYSEFASREVSGRLYRTWEHAFLYHEDGLQQIREIVRTRKKGLEE